ncbi:hypothetical protein F5887DRAFT_991096 [Amanita rubescens]|nr:hypothetical protein F5887DRAFT_1008115 [Amanita rubescens]KAF8331183.1 hypothetical protein F5887DRAFT_999133 [Amanita rubescens]KAF8334406.1 hypothetical protein F5887DRAFT_991096 [Amanita rubescens]
MGGGARYPYPTYVWSPAGSLSSTSQPQLVVNNSSLGGWWTRPHNWLSNTAIAFTGIIAATAMVWSISAKNERRTIQPDRPIPSMLWAKEFREKKE